MSDDWRRALLRAALRAVGYDAIGVHDIAEALGIPPTADDRGAVRLIVVDQTAFPGGAGVPTALRERYHETQTVLLARTTVAAPEGEWTRILRRPLSVDDVVTAAEAMLPLPGGLRHSLDP